MQIIKIGAQIGPEFEIISLIEIETLLAFMLADNLDHLGFLFLVGCKIIICIAN